VEPSDHLANKPHGGHGVVGYGGLSGPALACGAVLRLWQIPLGIGEAKRGRRRENALPQGAARFALVDYAALGRRGHFIGICGEGQSRDGLPI
jgi:hypothetical protein